MLDNTTATALTNKVVALERGGPIIKVINFINFQHLICQVAAIRQFLREHQIDFALFSCNDQVFDKVSRAPLIRALRLGYSSFIGIASVQALDQTRVRLDNYLASRSKLMIVDNAYSRCAPYG